MHIFYVQVKSKKDFPKENVVHEPFENMEEARSYVKKMVGDCYMQMYQEYCDTIGNKKDVSMNRSEALPQDIMTQDVNFIQIHFHISAPECLRSPTKGCRQWQIFHVPTTNGYLFLEDVQIVLPTVTGFMTNGKKFYHLLEVQVGLILESNL